MIFKRFNEDINAFMDRDPAARSRFEVVLCYPGFHALVFYRITHFLWGLGLKIFARWFSQVGKFFTGVEIHPAAVIGRRFVIDHGDGVVIGETSEIGDDVTVYQGVTLGGVSPAVDSRTQANRKRHPTLNDGAIIGSGAQVLGPVTIGEGARIGANAVVHRDVPAGVTAVGIPARVVMPRDKGKARQFVAYGEPAEGCPDPVLRTIESLRGQVAALMERVEELEIRQEGSKPDQEAKPEEKKTIVSVGE